MVALELIISAVLDYKIIIIKVVLYFLYAAFVLDTIPIH